MASYSTLLTTAGATPTGAAKPYGVATIGDPDATATKAKRATNYSQKNYKNIQIKITNLLWTFWLFFIFFLLVRVWIELKNWMNWSCWTTYLYQNTFLLHISIFHIKLILSMSCATKFSSLPHTHTLIFYFSPMPNYCMHKNAISHTWITQHNA